MIIRSSSRFWLNQTALHRMMTNLVLALAVLLIVPAATGAPMYESDQTELETYGESTGCYYNYNHYGEGDRIMTNEPCLNCTCHDRMLMCYLRVCPFTKAIGQDCTVEKREDQCCPVITCPEVEVQLVQHQTTDSPSTALGAAGTTQVGPLDQYGCSIHGRYYPEGAQVPSNPQKPCELCYCIRNMTTCVMQECTLHIDGCEPIYNKGVCCPVRYDCDRDKDTAPMLLDDDEGTTTTVRPTPGFILTTTLSPADDSSDCAHNGEMYAEGALIMTDQPCEHCYCMRGKIVCAVQECGTPLENENKNCTAVPPAAGQCCPEKYVCDAGDVSPTTATSTTAAMVDHDDHDDHEDEDVEKVERTTAKDSSVDDLTAEEEPEEDEQQQQHVPAHDAGSDGESSEESQEESELVGKPVDHLTTLPPPATGALDERLGEDAPEPQTDHDREGEPEQDHVPGHEAAGHTEPSVAMAQPTTTTTPEHDLPTTERSDEETDVGEGQFTTPQAHHDQDDAEGEDLDEELDQTASVTTGAPLADQDQKLSTSEPEHATQESPLAETPASPKVTTVAAADEQEEVSEREEPTTAGMSETTSVRPHVPVAFDETENEIDDLQHDTKLEVTTAKILDQTPEHEEEDEPQRTTSAAPTESSTEGRKEAMHKADDQEQEQEQPKPQSPPAEQDFVELPPATVATELPEPVSDSPPATPPPAELPSDEIVTGVPLEVDSHILGSSTAAPETTTTTTTRTPEFGDRKADDGAAVHIDLDEPVEMNTVIPLDLDQEVAAVDDEQHHVPEADQEQDEVAPFPEAIPGEGHCLLEGTTYANGEPVPASGKCQTSCRCTNSIVQCEMVHCDAPPSPDCTAKSVPSDECCPAYSCPQVPLASPTTVAPTAAPTSPPREVDSTEISTSAASDSDESTSASTASVSGSASTETSGTRDTDEEEADDSTGTGEEQPESDSAADWDGDEDPLKPLRPERPLYDPMQINFFAGNRPTTAQYDDEIVLSTANPAPDIVHQTPTTTSAPATTPKEALTTTTTASDEEEAVRATSVEPQVTDRAQTEEASTPALEAAEVEDEHPSTTERKPLDLPEQQEHQEEEETEEEEPATVSTVKPLKAADDDEDQAEELAQPSTTTTPLGERGQDPVTTEATAEAPSESPRPTPVDRTATVQRVPVPVPTERPSEPEAEEPEDHQSTTARTLEIVPTTMLVKDKEEQEEQEQPEHSDLASEDLTPTTVHEEVPKPTTTRVEPVDQNQSTTPTSPDMIPTTAPMVDRVEEHPTTVSSGAQELPVPSTTAMEEPEVPVTVSSAGKDTDVEQPTTAGVEDPVHVPETTAKDETGVTDQDHSQQVHLDEASEPTVAAEPIHTPTELVMLATDTTDDDGEDQVTTGAATERPATEEQHAVDSATPTTTAQAATSAPVVDEQVTERSDPTTVVSQSPVTPSSTAAATDDSFVFRVDDEGEQDTKPIVRPTVDKQEDDEQEQPAAESDEDNLINAFNSVIAQHDDTIHFPVDDDEDNEDDVISAPKPEVPAEVPREPVPLESDDQVKHRDEVATTTTASTERQTTVGPAAEVEDDVSSNEIDSDVPQKVAHPTLKPVAKPDAAPPAMYDEIDETEQEEAQDQQEVSPSPTTTVRPAVHVSEDMDTTTTGTPGTSTVKDVEPQEGEGEEPEHDATPSSSVDEVPTTPPTQLVQKQDDAAQELPDEDSIAPKPTMTPDVADKVSDDGDDEDGHRPEAEQPTTTATDSVPADHAQTTTPPRPDETETEEPHRPLVDVDVDGSTPAHDTSPDVELVATTKLPETKDQELPTTSAHEEEPAATTSRPAPEDGPHSEEDQPAEPEQDAPPQHSTPSDVSDELEPHHHVPTTVAPPSPQTPDQDEEETGEQEAEEHPEVAHDEQEEGADKATTTSSVTATATDRVPQVSPSEADSDAEVVDIVERVKEDEEPARPEPTTTEAAAVDQDLAQELDQAVDQDLDTDLPEVTKAPLPEDAATTTVLPDTEEHAPVSDGPEYGGTSPPKEKLEKPDQDADLDEVTATPRPADTHVEEHEEDREQVSQSPPSPTTTTSPAAVEHQDQDEDTDDGGELVEHVPQTDPLGDSSSEEDQEAEGEEAEVSVDEAAGSTGAPPATTPSAPATSTVEPAVIGSELVTSSEPVEQVDVESDATTVAQPPVTSGAPPVTHAPPMPTEIGVSDGDVDVTTTATRLGGEPEPSTTTVPDEDEGGVTTTSSPAAAAAAPAELPAAPHHDDVEPTVTAAPTTTTSHPQEEEKKEEEGTVAPPAGEVAQKPEPPASPVQPPSSTTSTSTSEDDEAEEDAAEDDGQQKVGAELPMSDSSSTAPPPSPPSPPSPVDEEQPAAAGGPSQEQETVGPSYGAPGQHYDTGYGHMPPHYPPSSYEDDYGEEEDPAAFGPGTCRYGGKLYVSAQQIPRDDPCDFCFCFRSDIICLQQSCPPPITGCNEEPIAGFCCPRYECPVSMATVLNVTTSTTTTTTTLPPHFLAHAYKGAGGAGGAGGGAGPVQKRGCQIAGKAYGVGEPVASASGPCMRCTCGGDGQMQCEPKACSPEPMLKQMIAVAAARKR